jgi:4-coumarate--CoA ligase
MISHQNVIAQSLQILPLIEPTHRKILAVLPSFHITGLVHVLHIPIVLNAEVYMLASFTMPSMLSVVEKYKIEELLLVPPILIRMVRDPVVDNYDLSCIKRFSSGAAPVSEEILQLLSKKFPSTGFKQGYGMTESCSCITATTKDKNDYKYAHTVGEVCASTEIRIVSEEGKELGINQPGELLAKGPQITMGYLNNEKATAETFLPDGFMRTGDQAVIDSAGVVTITDRIKEMIKVKGIGVAPAELEDLLLGHQYVEDCAVMGIPDDYSGERPKCFVVPKSLTDSANPGAQNEAELIGLGRELLNYVKEKKVRHKWLKEVEFVDVIPKSASGKILRRVLKNKKDTGVVVREVARAKL